MHCELGGDGRFADTLKSGEQNRDETGTLFERRVHWAHQLGEFFLANLDEVLARRDADLATGSILDARLDLFAEATLLDAGQKRTGHAEVDVGLEQRHADVAKRLVDARFVELANAAQSFRCGLESLGDCLEHGSLRGRRRVAAGHECARRGETFPGERPVASFVRGRHAWFGERDDAGT